MHLTGTIDRGKATICHEDVAKKGGQGTVKVDKKIGKRASETSSHKQNMAQPVS